jgi:hypothetical protein
MSSLLSISSMLREFWLTKHSNKLTCYGSSEGTGMRSPVNVVIAQHIIHAEGSLADNTQYQTYLLQVVGGELDAESRKCRHCSAYHPC